jgi:hypothetical protein
MISDEEIDESVDYLLTSAEKAAKARAERGYLQEFTKSLKALLMKEHLDKTVSAQEREALSDPRYLKHLEALRLAIKEDEQIRFTRVHHETKIEAWRSQSANTRSVTF